MAVYTTIDDPTAYFQTTLYTGDDSTSHAITNGGNSDLQADWLWLKPRTKVDNHRWMDSVRGVTKMSPSNSSGAEETISAGLASFDSNGFTLNTTDSGYNSSSYTYVAWCWKAGTSFTNDASSTGVGSIDSTASVSQTAGFSIVKYTGTGSNETVAHGLGLAPEIMICKNLSATENWVVYVKSLGNTKRLVLDTTAAVGTDATIFNSTTPNTTIFGIGENAGANGNGHGQIAYCFASVKGYSKIGRYTGNSNADGAYVHLGFKPAFLMVKRTDAAYRWTISDNKRIGFNRIIHGLAADSTAAEETGAAYGEFDFTANGFKCRSAEDGMNVGNMIYMAFAESPFVTSTGIPATAR